MTLKEMIIMSWGIILLNEMYEIHVFEKIHGVFVFEKKWGFLS